MCEESDILVISESTGKSLYVGVLADRELCSTSMLNGSLVTNFLAVFLKVRATLLGRNTFFYRGLCGFAGLSFFRGCSAFKDHILQFFLAVSNILRLVPESFAVDD